MVAQEGSPSRQNPAYRPTDSLSCPTFGRPMLVRSYAQHPSGRCCCGHRPNICQGDVVAVIGPTSTRGMLGKLKYTLLGVAGARMFLNGVSGGGEAGCENGEYAGSTGNTREQTGQCGQCYLCDAIPKHAE